MSAQIFRGVTDLVGRTPLIELDRLFSGGPRVFAKLECRNPAGSAKDRPAAAVLKDALATGAIRPGDTVVESSSGNFGVALAQQARWHGLRFVCVVDPRTNDATRRLIEAYGGEVHTVTRPDPDTGDWLVARILAVQQLVESNPRAWWPNQYANTLNAAAHRDGTMAEILDDLGHAPTALYVATSSTGTLVGCTEGLRRHGHDTRVVAVDAWGSVLFAGARGDRKLPGFGAGTVPALAALARPDALTRVSDLDCVVGCRRLVAREALLMGASAGGVVSALALDLAEHRADYRAEDEVVLIFHDGGERYLDTVYDDDWVASELGVSSEQLLALIDETSDTESLDHEPRMGVPA